VAGYAPAEIQVRAKNPVAEICSRAEIQQNEKKRVQNLSSRAEKDPGVMQVSSETQQCTETQKEHPVSSGVE